MHFLLSNKVIICLYYHIFLYNLSLKVSIFFLEKLLKQGVVQWLLKEEKVTLTCDVATVSGSAMLTVLVSSDKTGVTKLVGFKLVTAKDGAYLAEQFVSIVKENLGTYSFSFVTCSVVVKKYLILIQN